MVQNNELKNLYEETVVNLISNVRYVNLSFYGFILAKCNVSYDKKFPTLGVAFQNNAYHLVIGGKFEEWELEQRIAVLIHEVRHILGLHTFRKGERDHQLWNIACDIAINQTIKNLPEEGVFPETFDFPKNESAETYYELLKEEQEQQKQEKQEAEENGESWDGPEENSKGEQKPDLTGNGNGETIDSHEAWGSENGEESEELAKSIAEQMVKDAIEKSRGNAPGDIEKILNLLRRKPKISWKKVLRKIVTNKNGSKTETIKRKNRRLPNRNDLRGRKIQKDKPVVVVGIDTSGSMDNEDIINGLAEIYDVVKHIGKVKIVQIDTEIKGVEDYEQKSFKSFKRKGYGGTYMGVLPEYLNEHKKIECDVLIMISDLWIENVPEDSNWKAFKKPVIWLGTSGEKPNWDGWNKHKVMNIHQA